MGVDVTITCARGETHTINYSAEYADGSGPIDLSSATARYCVFDPVSRAILFSVEGADITHPDAYTLSFTLDGTDTDRDAGAYAHDFRYILGTEEIQAFGGDLVITDGVRLGT